MLKLKIKNVDIETGGAPIVLLNTSDAYEMGIHSMDRINVHFHKKVKTAIVDVTSKIIPPGSIGIFKELDREIPIEDGGFVNIEPAPTPASVGLIKDRLLGRQLKKNEIAAVVKDIVTNRLSDVESVFFMASAYTTEFSTEETVALTNAMVLSGEQLKFDKGPIVDKHSIGGIPGNRVTMIIVPIVAAAGLTMPKTSSRAISSPAGTADTMEVLAPVNLAFEDLKKTVMKTGACIAWGGSVNLVPVDDKLLQLRYPLRLDPKPFLLASILAKKKAAGSQKVIIDIPVGRFAKIKHKSEAQTLAYDFIRLGNKLGMQVQAIITQGDKPVGRGIGPALEARDVINILTQAKDAPQDLRDKSLEEAGIILELGGKAGRGQGYALAEKLLKSGKAWKKMQEIIKAQGGNPKVKVKDLPLGKHKHTIKSSRTGSVYAFDIPAIVKIARAAGAPKDKGGGIDLHVDRGVRVKKGMPLFTIYAEHENKLRDAIRQAEKERIVIMEKSIMRVIDNVTELPSV